MQRDKGHRTKNNQLSCKLIETIHEMEILLCHQEVRNAILEVRVNNYEHNPLRSQLHTCVTVCI